MLPLFLTAPFVVAAMLPPRVASVMPPGAQRGTEVHFAIKGERLVGASELLLCEPGLELLGVEPGKNAESCVLHVRVHQDAALGAHALRLRTPGGLSNLFHVFVGAQPEIVEAREGNKPQVLQAPCTVGGELTGEDPDRYVVTLPEGARCVCEIEAMRLLRSPIDLMVSVRAPDGREIGRVDDTAFGHKDPVLAFTAGIAGAYEIVVEPAFADRVNTGAYRLHVGDLPRPTASVPAGVATQQKTAIALLGDGALIATEVELQDDGSGYAPVFAADARGIAPTPVFVRVGGPPEVATVPPSDAATLQLLPYPSSTTGVVADRDGVRYRLAAKKGEVFEFRVLTLGIRSPLDPLIGVRTKDGKLVAGDDDGGAPAADSFVRATAPEDGELFVTVRDVMRRHSPLHLFRLECGPRDKATKCRLVVARGQDPVVTIPLGAQGGMVLQVDDADVDAGVAFVADRLPTGVTATFGRVQKGQNLVPFVMHAAADAPLAASLVALSLRAEKEPLVRPAGYAQVLPLVSSRNDQAILSVVRQELPVAIAAPVPYAVALVAPTVPIVRGAPLAVQVHVRRAEGFAGEVRLKALWTPTGVGSGEVTVPADKDIAWLPLDASANAPLGPFALAVRATATGKDEAFEVCSAFCEVVVDKPWLEAKLEGGRATLGGELALSLSVKKDAENQRAIAGPLQMQLLSLPRGVTSDPVAVASDAAAGSFAVRIAADAAVGKHKNVVLEVRVPVAGGEVVHRYAVEEIRIDEPKKKKAKPAAVEASAAPVPSGESKGGPQ